MIRAIVITAIIFAVCGLVGWSISLFIDHVQTNQAEAIKDQNLSGWTLISETTLSGYGFIFFSAPDSHMYISRYSGGLIHAQGCTKCSGNTKKPLESQHQAYPIKGSYLRENSPTSAEGP